MKDLSIIIPSNSEIFLSKTIEDILEHIEADTEIIAVLDGRWAKPAIPQNDRVNIIYVPKSIGQRASTNIGVKLSRAKYVMKVDAHCSFDQGFDRKMIEGFEKVGDNVTMVSIMRNLHAFDWKCYHCGWKKYQGPTPLKCESCGKSDKVRKKMMWIGKSNPQSKSYAFDTEPHFQYNGEYCNRPEYKEALKTGFTETMSLQGSAFMSTRENYWKWELCDETLGNWGNQGIEVALATWLNGGRVLVNHNTWYAHMFRTQGGDFSFPWHGIKGQSTDKTKLNVKNKYWKNPKLPDLIRKFMPVSNWNEESISILQEQENVL